MKLIFKVPVNYLKAFCFCSLLLTVIQSNAQMCTNPGSVIYSLSNAGGIYPITVSTGAVGSIINSTSLGSSSTANAIGYNNVNGMFYYFQNANSGTSQQFVSFNPSTNSYTTLASAPITGTVFKGCMSFNGTGYYCLDSKGNLCYYNITTNTWVLICSTFTDQYGNNVSSIFNSQASGDMAIDGLGNLWVVTSSTSSWGLYKIPTPLLTTSVASMTVQQLIAPTTAVPTSGANFVGIAFDPSGFIYMATNNDLYLLNSNFTLNHLAAFGTSGICGDLTSCNYPFAILPVVFQNVTAVEQNNKSVSVSWIASQQTDNNGFYVQHSVDGSNWQDEGFVAATGANGSSSKYSFADNNPASGINYYRIGQVDVDGQESFSEIKTVNINNTGTYNVLVWPNPARSSINIQNTSDANAVAKIYNQSGSLISESKLQSGNNNINVSALSFGAYIVNIKLASGENYNQKFIKE